MLWSVTFGLQVFCFHYNVIDYCVTKQITEKMFQQLFWLMMLTDWLQSGCFATQFERQHIFRNTNKYICNFYLPLMESSLQDRNVWEKLPGVLQNQPQQQLQRDSLLPPRPLWLFLCQRLVWEALWKRCVKPNFPCSHIRVEFNYLNFVWCLVCLFFQLVLMTHMGQTAG